jgi:acyl transferase domain-containing protein
MGRQLHHAFPVFAAAFDAACEELGKHTERPLREIVWAQPGTSDAALLDQTQYTQPALFAIEVALHHLMESFGLRPDMVAGHSVGEFAAAYAVGVFSLADAARLVAVRGRLMQALPSDGTMIALQAAEDEVVPLLAGNERLVAIAAVNGPASVVISGEEGAAGRIAAAIAEKGRKTRRLKVSHAFHSPLMDPVLAEFGSVARSVTFRPPSGPGFVSTVTGQPASAAELCNPDYWVEHIRRPVRFADALAALGDRGVRLYLETGPGNGLTGMAKAATAGQGHVFLPSLQGKGRDRGRRHRDRGPAPARYRD